MQAKCKPWKGEEQAVYKRNAGKKTRNHGKFWMYFGRSRENRRSNIGKEKKVLPLPNQQRKNME